MTDVLGFDTIRVLECLSSAALARPRLGERYQAFVRVVEFDGLSACWHPARQAAERPCGRSARLHRQGGVRHHHHAGAHRAAGQRLDAAAPVRLEQWRAIACVGRQRLAEPPARGAARGHHAGSSGRARLARFDGDRRPRETGAEAKAAGHVEAQARPAAQGRATAQEAAASSRQQEMTLAQMLADLPSAGDVHQAQRQRTSAIMDRLQAAYRRGRRRIPLSCILTSASLHDSQAAIPLAATTAAPV